MNVPGTRWGSVLVLIMITLCLSVSPALALTARMNGYPTQGMVPLMVYFSDKSQGSPVDWSWDFGDGTTAKGPLPVHTYMAPGVYPVSLTVTDASGLTDMVYISDGITVLSNPLFPNIPVIELPLVAGFTAEPRSGNAPLLVRFIDLSKGNATSWSWDLGDGVSSLRNPEHAYTKPGKYPVSLTVKNSDSMSTKKEDGYITVKEGAEPMTAEVSPVQTAVRGTIQPASLVSFNAENSSGFSLSLESVPGIIRSDTDFLTLVKGAAGEDVYIWITGQGGVKNPTGSSPFIGENQSSIRVDPPAGPYLIGSHESLLTGRTIRSMVGTSPNATRYYGSGRLNQSGMAGVIWEPAQNQSGNWTIHAESGDTVNTMKYTEINISI